MNNTKFKSGDKVVFCKSSLESGMIDAKEYDVFEIMSVFGDYVQVFIGEYLERFNQNHFEHVKEETMNTNEQQIINWEVGQEVFCLLRGKGVVSAVSPRAIDVQYSHGVNVYDVEGKPALGSSLRTLFFSEPKIEAEKFPPKKPFVPTLKKGDTVVVNTYLGSICHKVNEETETHLDCNGQRYAKQKIISIFKLGEEIKFN